MDEELIKSKLFQVVKDSLCISSEINLTDNLVDDLGADYIDIVYIVIELEEKFGVTIPEDSVEKCFTVGGLLNVLKENIK